MAVVNERERNKHDNRAARIYKMKFGLFIGLLLLGTCFSAPTDEPIRIDLPVYENASTISDPTSDIPTNQPLKPENIPGGDPVTRNGSIEGLITNKVQAVTNIFENSAKTQGIFAPVTTREDALQETEGYGSKILFYKENIQRTFATFTQPKPIVDTITESEKYGNTGDKFYQAGQTLVRGASQISTVVNKIIEVPGKILNSISRGATEKLNNLGAKLIGL